eukprot:TRINITY_DN25552_c0_g1_i1.p1 TRINITY_DN25552_c0_g1~~TRINITY_DN25552_c0_g1_i1.p1  ORF type:complete len:217 (+),score=15.51 TRINITY_DN25552_c0_g1_i1:36-686(+)
MKAINSLLLVVLFVGIVLADVPYHWTMYKQCDGKWANDRMGTTSETICRIGCAMSCVAMSLDSFGERVPGSNAQITPATLNTWLTHNGGYVSGNEIIWDSVHKIGRLHVVQVTGSLTRAQLVNYISRRMPVIANVRHGTHWVLLTGYSNSNEAAYNVNDPGFNQDVYNRSDMGRFIVYSFSTTEPAHNEFSQEFAEAHTLKEANIVNGQHSRYMQF